MIVRNPSRFWVIFVTAALLFSFSGCSGENKAAEPPTLTILSGDIQVQTELNWGPAVDATQLSVNSGVITASDSWALLTYSDASTITVEPESEISLVDSAEIQVKLISGKVWAVSNSTRINIETDASKASGTTTGFEVFKEGNNITVNSSGGTVKFDAGGSSVDIPSGQFATSDGGSPSSPQEIKVENALRMKLEGEVLLYLVDSRGLAIGYHPTQEITTNQIPLGWYSGKEGRPQIISVPNLIAGEYTILLVAAGNQSPWKLWVGTAGSDLVYEDTETSSMITWGTPTGITMDVYLTEGEAPRIQLSAIWTLYVAPPGKVGPIEGMKRMEIYTGPDMPPWTKLN